MLFALELTGIIIAAYLLGSINFAVIFARAFSNRDVRDYGSGNAGTTNVMRTVGFLPGLLTFVCDALKGVIACGAGLIVFRYVPCPGWFHSVYSAYACAIACMLGHMFPVFFQFKGGKGVAISVGIFLVCCPKLVPIALGIFILLALTTRIVSLSSLAAMLSAVILTCFFYNRAASPAPQIIMTVIMCILVYRKHTENIKRLIKGEEKKLTLRRSK